MSKNIAAVVVTYNRKQLLTECLDALLAQTCHICKIILIDNASTDGTLELLRERGYLVNPIIDYVRLPENTGGAGGFYEGVNRGYEAGYDWLWLMDDDSEPLPDALGILSDYFNEPSIIALTGLKVGEDGKPQYTHCGWFSLCTYGMQITRPIAVEHVLREAVEIDFASFVGILVSRKGIKLSGFPKKSFFIHHDDVEYCYRMRKNGNILLIPKSIIMHKDGRNSRYSTSTIFRRTSNRVAFKYIWITYYGIRNLTWMRKKYCKNYHLSILVVFLRITLGIIVYDNYKWQRIKFYSFAILDGLHDIFDNEKPKYLRVK